MNNKDLYDVLEVAADADGVALKKAYRKACGNQEPQARVLLRDVYDACGTEGLELLKQAQPKVRHAMQIDDICCVFFLM